MDQTKVHVLIQPSGSQFFTDRTDDVIRLKPTGGYIEVTFGNADGGGISRYRYRPENVRLYTQISEHDIHPHDEVKVDVAIWKIVTKIWVLRC